MSERGIIFTGESVRGILEGRKTQTRRIVAPMRGEQSTWLTADLLGSSPSAAMVAVGDRLGAQFEHPRRGPLGWVACPLGASGDRLWVRERWTIHHEHRETTHLAVALEDARQRMPWAHVSYRERDESTEGSRHRYPWRSPLYMPRWASRLSLEIVDVRVQRLQDISEDDARAEGADETRPIHGLINGEPGLIHCFGHDAALKLFALLWDAINGKRAAWATNPWVWALTFRRVT